MTLRDALGCISWSAILLMASLWIPIFGPFVSLLSALPFLYYATKLGLKQGAILLVMTVAAVGVFVRMLGYPQLFFFSLELGIFGLALSEIFRRELGFGRTVLTAMACMLGLGALFLTLGGLAKGLGPVALVEEYLRASLSGALEAFSQMAPDSESAREAREYGEAVLGVLMRLLPSLAVLGTGFVVFLNILMSRPLFRFGGLAFPAFGPLDQWKSPERLVWALIASGFALFFSSGGIKWLGLNALIVILAIYLLQGFSILFFFLNKYRVPPWVRMGIYFVIAFQQLFFLVLAAAGVFDQWIDFRKVEKEGKKS